MIQVISEAEIMREASQILLEHLSPVKAARFWASWYAGQGDYLDWRDETFGKETVDSLFPKIFAFQDKQES